MNATAAIAPDRNAPVPKALATVALAALLSAGCSTLYSAPEATAARFEVEYVNFAWTPTWQGLAIHEDGTITSFDLDGRHWEQDGERYVSVAELEAKWAAGAEARGRVGAEELAAMHARVDAAAAAALTEPVHRCADAGTITYSVYRYDAVRGRLERVVLRRAGDTAQLRSSEAARALAEWLDGLTPLDAPEGCGP